MRDALIKERRKRNLTQEQVAQSLNISTVYVRKIEKGDRTPGRATLFKFEQLYGVPVKDLFPELFKNLVKGNVK